MLGFLLGVSATAAAQERGRVGLTVAHPASVGLIWHASDRVAVRPDFNFTFSTSESEGPATPFTTGGSSGEGWAVGVGTSVLFYLQEPDGPFRTYLAPRVSYSRGTSTSTSPTGFEARSTSRGWTWSLSYGGQYLVADRFGLFGEAGVGGASTRLTSTASQLRTTGHSWGTRGGVGVTIYF